MNTTGSLTVIDDYLDALLDSASAGSVSLEGKPAQEWPDERMPAASPLLAVVESGVATAEADEAADVAGCAFSVAPLADNSSARPASAPAIAAPPVVPAQPASPTAPVHAPPAPATASSHRWLRVAVGGDSYALELLRVQEVVRLVPIVAMRGANRAVLGVMNLRGRIVPVYDLGLWLAAGCVHADGSEDDGRRRIVVVERDDELIGVLVSAVEDVVTLGRDRIEPPLVASKPGAVLGVARVGAAPTVLLDANALFGDSSSRDVPGR